MISRIWHGWTTRENAAAYEALLRSEILPGIANRSIPGLRGAHLLRRDVSEGVEFVTILWFDTLDAVPARNTTRRCWRLELISADWPPSPINMVIWVPI